MNRSSFLQALPFLLSSNSHDIPSQYTILLQDYQLALETSQGTLYFDDANDATLTPCTLAVYAPVSASSPVKWSRHQQPTVSSKPHVVCLKVHNQVYVYDMRRLDTLEWEPATEKLPACLVLLADGCYCRIFKDSTAQHETALRTAHERLTQLLQTVSPVSWGLGLQQQQQQQDAKETPASNASNNHKKQRLEPYQARVQACQEAYVQLYQTTVTSQRDCQTIATHAAASYIRPDDVLQAQEALEHEFESLQAELETKKREYRTSCLTQESKSDFQSYYLPTYLEKYKILAMRRAKLTTLPMRG